MNTLVDVLLAYGLYAACLIAFCAIATLLLVWFDVKRDQHQRERELKWEQAAPGDGDWVDLYLCSECSGPVIRTPDHHIVHDCQVTGVFDRRRQ